MFMFIFEVLMFCRTNSLQYFVFPHVVMSFLSTYRCRYIGLFMLRVKLWVLFFLSHFYLWIFVFLDLELNPDHDWIQNSFKNISYQDLIGWSKELSERRTKFYTFDVLLSIYMIFVWLWWKAIVRFTVSL